MVVQNTDPSNSSHTTQTSVQTVDGHHFITLIFAGLKWLKTNQEIVNKLNVFPVPDGDTGTNMVLTLQSAVNDIQNLDERNIGKVAHIAAQGALMGARGNSGVILSQLFRGFARALDNFEYMDSRVLINALLEARNTAYKGVIRPVEGTILTVAKDIASAADSRQDISNLTELLELIVSTADESVKRTPELLPILKQAKVVDSGGKGLFFILEGMLRHVQGLPLDQTTNVPVSIDEINLNHLMEEVEEGQDYEIVIDFKPHTPLNLEDFYSELSKMGTSIQVGEGDSYYRMHIHVPEENQFAPIEYTQKLGVVSKIAIENLMEQMESTGNKRPAYQLTPVTSDQIAVIAVAPGEGIAKIFASLGVAGIVFGGQTMNPSTEEIISSFDSLTTDKVIILPNNKNIILAAQSAALVSQKHIKVVTSKSVPQGISAILRFDPDGDLEEVFSKMQDALSDVETGEITNATRSVELNGIQVDEGQVIILHNGVLTGSASTIKEAVLKFLETADTSSKERITFFYGSNIEPEEVSLITDQVQEIYPDHEVEIHEGGQPFYQFIISLE